jgi:hypothetical protein
VSASHPLPLPGRWSRLDRRRIAGVAATALLAAGLLAGAAAWVTSTRPADPLNRYPGFGFEGSGVTRVPLGAPRGFSAYLLGDTPSSRAVITGVTLPRVPGVRLQMYALVGRPRGQFVGFPVTATGPFRASRLRPLVGRALQPPPAGFGSRDWFVTVALVATPLTPGCHRVTGVAIRYRVGDTTFTKRMNGAISVATGRQGCLG